MVIYGKHDRASEHDWTKPASKNRIDHFERFISILKIPNMNFEHTTKNEFVSNQNKKQKLETRKSAESSKQLSNESILRNLNASKVERAWIARRIDLIISPIDQFPYAILGWTGSRHFIRSIRLYSEKEMQMKLSSHGLYDHKQVSTYEITKSTHSIFSLLCICVFFLCFRTSLLKQNTKKKYLNI